MSREAKLGRRGFLGIGAAFAGGAALGSAGIGPGTEGLQWALDAAFPGSHCQLLLQAPGLSDGTRLAVTVHLRGPEGGWKRQCGDIVLQNGKGLLSISLWYPYERRVPGCYVYEAEAIGKEVSFKTVRTTGYSVREVVPFS